MAKVEHYYWLMPLKLQFDVVAAEKIIKAKNRKARRISVRKLKPALDGHHVNKSYVQKANVKNPVIMGTLGNNHFLMDGHHRLTKAIKVKRKFIQMYLLTSEETRQCATPKRTLDKLCNGLPHLINVK